MRSPPVNPHPAVTVTPTPTRTQALTLTHMLRHIYRHRLKYSSKTLGPTHTQSVSRATCRESTLVPNTQACTRAHTHTYTHPRRVSHGCLAEDTVRTPSGALSLRAGPWSDLGIGVRFCTGLGVLSLPYPLGEGWGGGGTGCSGPAIAPGHVMRCLRLPLRVSWGHLSTRRGRAGARSVAGGGARGSVAVSTLGPFSSSFMTP